MNFDWKNISGTIRVWYDDFKKSKFSQWLKVKGRTFINTWWLLLKTILDRFFSGFTNSNFFLYFFVVIIIVGGLGCSSLFYNYYNYNLKTGNAEEYATLCLGLAKSLSTYFIALIATSSADLILNKKPNSREASVLRLPALTMLIVGGISLFLIQYNLLEDAKKTLNLAFMGTILALLFWWVANSFDDKYSPHDDGQNTTEANYNPLGGIDPDNLLFNDQMPDNIII